MKIITMQKIQKSQARAIVGGSFFSTLRKIAFGGPLVTIVSSLDPVAGTAAATAGAASVTRMMMR